MSDQAPSNDNLRRLIAAPFPQEQDNENLCRLFAAQEQALQVGTAPPQAFGTAPPQAFGTAPRQAFGTAPPREQAFGTPPPREQEETTREFLRQNEEMQINDNDNYVLPLIQYHDGKTRREDWNQYNIMASYNEVASPPQVVPPRLASTIDMDEVIPLMEKELDSMRSKDKIDFSGICRLDNQGFVKYLQDHLTFDKPLLSKADAVRTLHACHERGNLDMHDPHKKLTHDFGFSQNNLIFLFQSLGPTYLSRLVPDLSRWVLATMAEEEETTTEEEDATAEDEDATAKEEDVTADAEEDEKPAPRLAKRQRK